MLSGCVPWPEEYAALYRAKGYWEDITIPEMLERTIRAVPEKTAIVIGDRRISYRELGRLIDRMAYGFVRGGIKPLDRVVFHMVNSAELAIAFIALIKAGAIPVMALPAHRHTEIGHFIARARAAAYLIPDVARGFDYREMATEMVQRCPSLRHVFVVGTPGPDQHDLLALLDEPVDEAEMAATLAACRPPADEVALMVVSGGTTGLSKLIPRTHNDYIHMCKVSGAATGFDRNMVLLMVLQMAHNFPLGGPGFLGVFAVGGTVVIAPGTAAEDVFSLIEKERVTMICAAVPLVTAWLNASVPEQRYDLSSLRALMSGGARLAPELRRRIELRFRCTYIESFGTGEGMLMKTRPDDPDEIRYSASGRPVSPGDEIRVVDDLDQEVPDGVAGELLGRGPYTIRGYYNDPEANAKAFTADGFYRMGDIVKRIGRYVYVEGRRKDLVNRGGEKISCEEVENHILAHPAVASACVVAMPDDEYGEKACAFVILRKQCSLTFKDLTSFLLTRNIAKFKLPERLEIVGSFPISAADKILRRELRAIIANMIAAEKAATATRFPQRLENGAAG